MKIRPALLTDITQIVVFCRDHEHLLGPDDPRVNPAFLRRQLRNCIKDKDAIVLIAVEKHKVFGVLVGWIMNWAWSPERYGTDILYLADKGGAYLMNRFHGWCRQMGARRCLQLTHLAHNAERVEQLYSRSGYQQVGAAWEKRL